MILLQAEQWPSEDACILKLWMLPYVVKETTSLVTSRALKGGIALRHLHRPIAVTGVLIGGKREGQEQKGWDREGWPAGLERAASSLRRRRARALLRSPEKGPARPTPGPSPCSLGLPASGKARSSPRCVKPLSLWGRFVTAAMRA